MELLLPFHVVPAPHKISYADKILFLGSCFSEEIAGHMQNLKFNVMQNPNGILYDPASISSALASYKDNKEFTESDLFTLDGLWHSWQHHSAFSGLNKESVLQNIHHTQSAAHEFLKAASWLVITPGTAHHYQLTKTGKPVANCHKAPADFFEKKLMPVEEIINYFSNGISQARNVNSGLKVIFTISPVRHIKDGVIENNRSKSRLIEAIHSLKENMPDVFYFPAYELVIDVLRDYRFYKKDLVHPSDVAIEFVWETFCNAFIDEPGKKLMEEINRIVTAVNHKPFQRESAAHKKFMQAQLQKIRKLGSDFPSIDFTNEEKHFSGSNVPG